MHIFVELYFLHFFQGSENNMYPKGEKKRTKESVNLKDVEFYNVSFHLKNGRLFTEFFFCHEYQGILWLIFIYERF